MISVICVYNDREILNKWLLKSLENQNTSYELILVDNCDGKFKSAAEALNQGGKKANNKYIMFVHQDMDINSHNWLKDAEKILDSLENVGIVGLAGKSRYHWWPITNMKDGISPQPISPYPITEITEVETLDECLIIVPKEVFDLTQFDEVNCDNWHLYSVDYCLILKKIGYNVYVIPLTAHHRSHGYSMSETYFQTLKKLMKKHSNSTLILTTVEDWLTIFPLSFQRKFPYIKRMMISIIRQFRIITE